MTLREFLLAKSMTQGAFAERVGLSQSHVSRLVSGEGNLSLDTMKRIHVATDGLVTPNDFLICGIHKAPQEDGVAA